jgi:hypothetical protein
VELYRHLRSCCDSELSAGTTSPVTIDWSLTIAMKLNAKFRFPAAALVLHSTTSYGKKKIVADFLKLYCRTIFRGSVIFIVGNVQISQGLVSALMLLRLQ